LVAAQTLKKGALLLMCEVVQVWWVS